MPPQVARLEVQTDRQRIHAGEIVQIYWTAVGVSDVLLEPPGQRMPASGRMVIRPETTTTYWISAINASGGETRPVTVYVEGTPDPQITVPPPAQPVPIVVPAPSAPIVVPAPQAQAVPAAASVRVQPVVASPEQCWIQVVALTNRASADRLVEELAQHCGERPVIQEVPEVNGKGPFYRVRFGPFSSIREARLRLKALWPHLKGTGSAPYITVH